MNNKMTNSQGNELDNRFRNTLNNYSSIINDFEGVFSYLIYLVSPYPSGLKIITLTCFPSS